jgi:uncharacterized membrane protein
MKKAVFLAVLVSIVLLAGNVLASTYEIELSQYGTKILEKHKISLDASQKIMLDLPVGYSSLDVLNPYTIEKGKLIIEGKNIEFSFIDNNAIEKGRKYYFTKRIEPKLNLTTLNLKLVLDEGFVVSKDIYPQATKIESDGRKIIIEWQFNNFKQDEYVPVFVVFESVEKINYFWIIILMLVLGVMGWLLYPLLRKKLEERKAKKKPLKKKKEKEDVTKFLLENEKKVFEEVLKEKEIWQKQLQLRTGLSKVKLSRVLKNLESRGLIKKINFGKTNKILIKK